MEGYSSTITLVWTNASHYFHVAHAEGQSLSSSLSPVTLTMTVEKKPEWQEFQTYLFFSSTTPATISQTYF